MSKATTSTRPAQESLDQVSGRLRLDAEAIRTRCDAVLGEALYWFPVRHHSPAVARHLEAALLRRKPKIVFIEGPHEGNHLIPHIIDPKTRPPVAVYSSYRDDANVLGLAGIESPAADIPARFACWYPLLAYSPEYVAMLAAKKASAEVVFVDLPHHALIRPASARQLKPPAEADGESRKKDRTTSEPEDDRLIVESGFYQKLAEVAGYRTWDEAWDSLFECREFADVEEFRRELATFCCASRATSDPKRIRADGTVERERFMLRTIRQTLAKKKVKPEEAMVVCGGFHLFLDRNDPEPPPAVPEGTTYVTVVPYSFFRVSQLSGYAAGNRAPQFYQLGWDLLRDDRAEDTLVEYVVDVLKQVRRQGEPLSSADAIAVSQHARMLGRLRGRPTPILDDIHDALITCCCKGKPEEDGTHLLKAIDAVDIGTKIGKVTAALGRLPIVNDFHTQLSDLELGALLEKEKTLELKLDKRQEKDARRSVFFHRLAFLKVPLGEQRDATAGEVVSGTLFKEKWVLRWSPSIEPALIEQNLYGDTVESAALSRLREELAHDEGNAARTCQRLAEAIDMDLPNLVRQVEDACGQAIDTDERFASLSQALATLTVIDRHAVFRGLSRDVLDDLIRRCFDRACFAIPGVASVPEQQQQEVVGALQGLAEVVLRGDRPELDRTLFIDYVRKAAQDSTVPFLRGVFLGMLAELREITTAQLAAEVSALARAPADVMVTAGDFLDGILAVSRTSIMLGADALIVALDELLRAAEWEPFLIMVPRLRAAFERLHEQQRESLASRVAELYGLKETESLTELRTSVGAAARIARIDRQVDEIMHQWDF
jgi:hypothetical protein